MLLAYVLKQNSVLATLKCVCSPFAQVSAAWTRSHARVLTCSLGSLGNNDLKAEGAAHVAGALKSNTTLRELKCANHP